MQNKDTSAISTETAGNIGMEPQVQIARKVPTSSSDNFVDTSKNIGDKTIKGKPPRQHAHEVHTEPQAVLNING